MSKLLVVATAAIASSLLTACPLAPSCSAFQGAGDQVFASTAGDSFVACENGGFAATFANGRSLSGLRRGNNVIDPATGAIAFDFVIGDVERGDQIARSQTLGGGAFTAVDTNEVTLDHADAMCRDLAAQPWFTTQRTQLPIATLFVAEDATDDNAGTIGSAQMLLCPDGTAQVELADGSPVQTGTYSAEDGELGVFAGAWNLSGSFEDKTGKTTDGELATFQLSGSGTAHWITVDPTSGGDLHCGL